jgi:ribosomal protein S18 acetylase RimI-like enzyme
MELAERVAASMLETERIRVATVEGGEVLEVDGLLVALTNLPVPELNGTWVAREPRDPVAALAGARDVFRSRGHAFFGIEVEVGRHPAVEQEIQRLQFRRVEVFPAMAAAIAGIADAEVPPGVEIRAVASEEDLVAMRSIETDVFGTPAAVCDRFIGPRLLTDDRVASFVASADGLPVGQSIAYLDEDIVGVFGVGVRETHRRRGLAGALTVRAARAFGDRADMAWLQPSEMALGLYGRLGFREVSQWEVWAPPPV